MSQSLLRRTLVAILAMSFLSACAGLSGEVEIVATLPASSGDTAATLPESAPDLASGQRIYQENCTACHGETGNGQGELVQTEQVPPMPSFLNDEHMREQSPAYYYDIITNGNLENLMPPWSNRLTEQERWDVAMYAYTLHYSAEDVDLGAALLGDTSDSFITRSDQALYNDIADSNPALSPDETWAAVAYRRIESLQNFAATRNSEATTADNLPDTVTITGTLSNGTEGSTVPDNLAFDLRYGTVDSGFETLAPTTIAGNNYTFENVPVDPASEYVVVAQYQQRVFFSDFKTGIDLVESSELPLTIYDVTEDPSVVTLKNINLTVQPLSVESLGTGLIFSQVNTYENTSDKVLSLRPPDQNQTVSLLVQFPPGSVLLTNNNPRYISAQEQNIIIDTAPVYPGEHEIAVTYFLPYDDGAVIDLPVTTAFDGTLTVELQNDALTIDSDTLTQTSDTPDSRVFTGEYELASQETIRFDLIGSVFGSGNSSEDAGVLTGNIVLVLVIIIAVILAALTVMLFWLQNRDTSADREISQILKRLKKLEREHDAGRINHDVYKRQRNALNERLNELRTSSTDDD